MKKALAAILLFDLVALSYGISTLSISYLEARIYFDEKNPTAFLANLGVSLLGQNDLGLRLPFVFLHLLSAILLYLYALKITKTKQDALYSLILFLLLPGTVASALCVNEAALVIFLSLLILCAYEYGFKKCFYVLLFLALFVDGSFALLFLSFFFYALYKKNLSLVCFTIFLLALNINLYEFDYHGRPRGYFLDTLGVFAACFSPLVFLYYFYVIYRFAFKPDKPLLWFVMTVSFLFCLVFSLRQRLYLEVFLPFCVLCTPLLISSLMASYRIRLPKLRTSYTVFIQSALIFLLFAYLVIIFNTFLYAFIKEPSKHFVYDYHRAKDLAFELKNMGITGLKTDEAMQLRLKFYGLSFKDDLVLERTFKKSDLSINLGPHSEYYTLRRLK
ncbi:hypothetical protein [Campylobacter troglodytis]|uniref:hypothetical protein n=1 Tax=Campylobacter troglodytis TaxID=654363 RepID=UPI00115868F3|nr:hypothetical protein [Campylobacter troglodytis]TQR56883.1 hypothetical protein DMC01_08900 [Campylobacter troglodytis]